MVIFHFQNGGCPPNWCFKVEYLSHSKLHNESAYQILLKLVKGLWRYHHFLIFKMAVVSYLRFVWGLFGPPTKIDVLNLVAVSVVVLIIRKFQYLVSY